MMSDMTRNEGAMSHGTHTGSASWPLQEVSIWRHRTKLETHDKACSVAETTRR